MGRFNLLSSFLPWIVFGFLSSLYPVFAIPSAILLSLFSYSKLMKGFVLDWGSLLFFVVAYIDSRIFHHTWLADHTSTTVFFFFVGIAAFSLLIHRPFTLQYAKLEVAKEKWGSPHFLRINQWMTAGFGMIFLVMALVTLYRTYHPEFLNQWLVGGIGLLIQVLFIEKFPQWYLNRVLK